MRTGMALNSTEMKASVILRQWRDEDLDPFAAMNADCEVMRFLPKRLSKAESEEMLARLRAGIDERGWGLWAVEVDGALAGFTGLAVPKFSAHSHRAWRSVGDCGGSAGDAALHIRRRWRRRRSHLRR